MLRTLSVGNSLPYSWPIDYNATFQAGQCAQLTLQGNAIVGTVSNGTAPLGLIDDVRTKAFTAVSWDETIIVPAAGVSGPGGTIISSAEIKTELANANVTPDSFVSIPVSVELIARNGVIVFPAGTQLNFDLTGSGTPNAIKTVVRYSYQIPNIIGDDTTQGSGRMTVWFQRGIYQTDQYDPTASYPLNANLYVNEKGMLTTTQVAEHYPAVGLVTSLPSAHWNLLEFLWL